MARLGAVIVVLAVLGAGLTACGTGGPTHANRVQVSEGRDVSLIAQGGDVEVLIPGDAIAGSGELSVTETRSAEGTAGWSVALSGGAHLVGKATLRFKHAFAKDEPAPLIVSTENGTDYEPAQNVRVQDGYAVVTTTHFSNWFTTWWSDVLDHLRGMLDFIYRGSGTAPTCAGEEAVRTKGYSVRSDGGNRVFWCLGQDAKGRVELKVVNGRGYTVGAESTPGLSVAASDRNDFVGLIADAVKEAPSVKRNTVDLVGPGGGLTYRVDGGGEMGVQLQPSVPGYLVTAAQYAVDTVAYVLSVSHWPGMPKAGRPSSKIESLFNWESCFAGFSGLMGSKITSSEQGAKYFADAIGAALGCTGDAIAKAGLGFFATAYASVVSWLVSGVRTAMNGFGAAADTALNPSGYTITVKAPSPAGWIVDATGIGPIKRDKTSYAEFSSVLTGARTSELCGQSDAWFATGSPPRGASGWRIEAIGKSRAGPYGELHLITFDATKVVDAPKTARGITLGTRESVLARMGLTGEHTPIDNGTMYKWNESGTPLLAVVHDGVVDTIAVNASAWYPDC